MEDKPEWGFDVPPPKQVNYLRIFEELYGHSAIETAAYLEQLRKLAPQTYQGFKDWYTRYCKRCGIENPSLSL